METACVYDGTEEVEQLGERLDSRTDPCYVLVIDEDQRFALEQACVCAIVLHHQIEQHTNLDHADDIARFGRLRQQLVDLKHLAPSA